MPSKRKESDINHLLATHQKHAIEKRTLFNNTLIIFSNTTKFQAIGHGIPASLLENIRQVTREFFELSMEEKNKYAKGVNDFEGYGADPVPAEGQSLDWSDRLFLEVHPNDRRNPKFWPENPTSFRYFL